MAFPCPAISKPPARPNIVYILADDLGYGDVGALNPQRGKIKTPNIDRLAAEGMAFTDAHSGSSVCTPTRYGILTGRYGWRTRLQGRWKLALCAGSGGWGKPGDDQATRQGLPSLQLHDLDADIAETRNVQADQPDVVARLNQLLEGDVADGRSTPGVKQSNDAMVDIAKSNARKVKR